MAYGHAEPCLQLGHSEGLGDEVIGTAVERLDLAVLVAVGGKDDDRDMGELPNPSTDLNAVEIGQAQVEDDEIRTEQCHLADGVGSRVRRRDLVAASRQPDPQRLDQRRVVVDHQNLRHVVPFGSRMQGHTHRSGHGEDHGSALGHVGLDPDGPSVGFDERLGDGQPEPGPCPATVLAEHLEDPLPLLAGDPGPSSATEISTSGISGPATVRAPMRMVRVDGASAWPRSPSRLARTCPISIWSISSKGRSGAVSTQTRIRRDEPADGGERFIDQLVEGNEDGPNGQRSGLNAGHVQQVGHQPGQAIGLQLNQLEQIGPVRRTQRDVRPDAGWIPPS